jgi:hypothetical protein
MSAELSSQLIMQPDIMSASTSATSRHSGVVFLAYLLQPNGISLVASTLSYSLVPSSNCGVRPLSCCSTAACARCPACGTPPAACTAAAHEALATCLTVPAGCTKLALALADLPHLPLPLA